MVWFVACFSKYCHPVSSCCHRQGMHGREEGMLCHRLGEHGPLAGQRQKHRSGVSILSESHWSRFRAYSNTSYWVKTEEVDSLQELNYLAWQESGNYYFIYYKWFIYYKLYKYYPFCWGEVIGFPYAVYFAVYIMRSEGDKREGGCVHLCHSFGNPKQRVRARP